ncbi:MAG: alpha/beta fold hydrolase [Gammaproteobacteria bacterium]|nr:alpha/beta fold hydrolase [Gammaproteobacteria bacterium]
MPYLLILLIGLLGGCVTLDSRDEAPAGTTVSGPKVTPVFYATCRKPSSKSGVYFGSERAELSYGSLDISIPARHLVGRKEAPSLLKFQYSEDHSKHIAIQWHNSYFHNAFYHYLNKALDQSGGKLMIFVHGYNVEFSDAARSLGQFATDLKYNPGVLFSWPSQGSLTGYTVDATNAEWAQSLFLDFLKDILDNTQAREIQIVGHSMGTRLITRGMATLAADRSREDMQRFGNIVLLAPDIDADVFRRDLAPRIESAQIPVTLYASSGDKALIASKAFNGYHRAGDSGEELVIVPGVETIDASEVAGGLLGHTYFAEDPRIIGDIYALLQANQRADQRFALAPVQSKDGRYWVFRK